MNIIIARVRPQPGQAMPKVDFSGHCQTASPVAVKTSGIAARATTRMMCRRFFSNGPRTGEKKKLRVPAILTGSAFMLIFMPDSGAIPFKRLPAAIRFSNQI